MSYQNPRQKGSRRDREIIHAIEECGVLNTEQVTALFFRFQFLIGTLQTQQFDGDMPYIVLGFNSL